jgi:hypothetical protein
MMDVLEFGPGPDAQPASCPVLPVPPVTDIARRDTIRLIPSGRLKPPVLAPLAATDQALNDLAALEGVTNGRIQACGTGLPGLDPRELVFGRPNDSFINAAFTHMRPAGNRFNDALRGAWYCGWDAATSLGEVAYHLTRELDAIGRYDTHVDYAELIADFIGPFHDLRASPTATRGLVDVLGQDTAVAYPAGQALARRLQAAGSNGLIYPSVRYPGGTCLAAFRPSLVQNLRQGGLWRLTWAGSRDPAITAP